MFLALKISKRDDKLLLLCGDKERESWQLCYPGQWRQELAVFQEVMLLSEASPLQALNDYLITHSNYYCQWYAYIYHTVSVELD